MGHRPPVLDTLDSIDTGEACNVSYSTHVDGFRVNDFTGRAQNSPPPFTPEQERASGKALTNVNRDLSRISELPNFFIA